MQPVGTAATGACPGPCQCLEEEIWNSNVPPKPNCRWLNNFAELRRQWSDHGRQQACKCCYGCSRCEPRFVTVIRFFYLRQKCCGSRRLAGGASKSEMAPIDKSSSSNPRKRETGGGCPPPSCTYPSTRYNSANADCSSIASSSSCCSSPCRHPRQASSHWAPDCQHPYVLKSILKKRSCYQCNTNQYCMCQPMPRGCNCPPPIQVDARAAHECSCECPSSPECACPPSERRFPKETIKCPNACLCCPFPRLSPGPTARCHSPYCQSCLPPPCGPCLSAKCRRPVPPKDLCQSNSPCPSCSSCRPVSTAFPCRPPTSCRKLTFCTERSDRPSSPCTGQFWSGINVDKRSENSVYNEQVTMRERRHAIRKNRRCTTDYTGSDDKFECNEKCRDLVLNESSVQNSSSKTFINLSETRTKVTRGMVHPVGVSCTSEETSSEYAQMQEEKDASACYDVFSNLGDIGYSTLVPSPLALISFVLLILVAITWSSSSTFYHRYALRKKICWK
ncbi:uncharacterized protein LOC105432533 [Pogonomyrmex barbatus]|uniref:Uncharacterized protein LOC105432533 n=1 Tax=Pogonomyrmex barbatus TaxID=144034 RepID=A0A6I9WZS1_9HYME|nr:uncharacterized protein LOC105432533 [Pogonomyrmex barbatus]